jgi:hypothetical protein
VPTITSTCSTLAKTKNKSLLIHHHHWRIAGSKLNIDRYRTTADASEPRTVALPNLWLWDMIDEFIYQFQNFCQYRTKLKSKSESEIATLKANPDAWHPAIVTNYLTSFIKKSETGVSEQEKASRR